MDLAAAVSLMAPAKRELTRSDQRLVLDTLEMLARRDGRVTPDSFLAEATPETSPLHPFFEWDDGRAAHEHRLHQARQIVRTVTMKVVRVEVQPRRMALPVVQTALPAPEPAPAPTTAVRSSGRVARLAAALEAAIRDAKGTEEIIDELRELRAILAVLVEKAPFEGKRCPRCQLIGHGPGSPLCLQSNANARRAVEIG